MYEEMTYEAILRRMLARAPSNVDVQEGTIIYDAEAAAAAELKLVYLEFDRMLRETFADESSRPYLVRRCAERGITPAPATHAVLRGVFVPPELEIETGRVFNLEQHNYTVVEKLAPGEYSMQCDEAGSEANSFLGDLIPQQYVNGLRSAKLVELLIPGRDEQGTESLRAEYFESFAGKAFGGNKKDYRNKTNEIQGVGATRVTPFHAGGGTVRLTILGADFSPASPALIELVQQTMDPRQDGQGDGMAPIGHVVTVDTAAPVEVDLQTSLTYAEGATPDLVKPQVEEALAGYLLELRRMWESVEQSIVRLAQLETRIMGIPGVLDISDTRLNGDAENMVLSAYEVPVPGEVTL